MKRQQLYHTARQNIERRRQGREAAAEAAWQQLQQASPAIAAVSEEIAQTGAHAAALAANGQGEDAAAALARLDELIAQKQQMAKALLPPTAPHCPLCEDTGQHDGRTCACVLEEMRRLRREEINRQGPFTLSSFESFSLQHYPEEMEEEGRMVHPRAVMAQILRDCTDWAETFGPRSPSLFIYGNAGLGKTHMALAIARRVLDGGHDVIYVSAQRAFATIAGTGFGADADEEDLFASMLEADLLVLDDLGTEYLNAFIRGKLYDLVNSRMGRRPTVYTTNICRREVLEQRYDEKISSRLLGSCHLMRFWGEDVRLQKHKA